VENIRLKEKRIAAGFKTYRETAEGILVTPISDEGYEIKTTWWKREPNSEITVPK